jgi:hypothetical protein
MSSKENAYAEVVKTENDIKIIPKMSHFIFFFMI